MLPGQGVSCAGVQWRNFFFFSFLRSLLSVTFTTPLIVVKLFRRRRTSANISIIYQTISRAFWCGDFILTM